ncbi:MAG: TIGR02757 family protein [Paludibacteraceae bacterium]|nr:TIGR02757 family protein [Paludibacteraceae bacterium]
MTNWEKLIAEYNDMRYFATDPVAVVKRCKEQKDIEVMGIVCSWLAYGNRNQIYKKCCMAYDLMSAKPYDYVMSGQWREYKDSDKNFYRLFFYRDFHDLMQSLYNVYQQYATLEEALFATLVGTRRAVSYDPQGAKTRILESLISFFNANGIPQNTKSACKRLCLFLRWMVRRDGIVDLGVWTKFSPADLFIPLDVHVNRVAHQHGLLTRTSADMRAVLELTQKCKELYPYDPTIMDFALFGAGYTSK